MQKPTWLIGKWERVNESDDNKTYEFWNNDYTGLGFTLQNKDTTFVEKMSIIQYEDKMYLNVIGMDNAPTLFVFTKQTDHSFIAENKQNQFPKKIEYSYNNETLNAVISNDEFSVDFSFKKTEH